MTMAVDSRSHHQFGGMGYDSMRQYQPQFSNPWHTTTAAHSPHQMYQGLAQSSSEMDHHQSSRAPIMSMGYVANPAASSLGSDLVPSRSYGTYGSSAPTSQPASAYAPTSAPRYSPEHQQAQSPYDYPTEQFQRRSSFGHSNDRAYDEMASARGMVAMATNGQDLATPRPIYGNGAPREAAHDSYGFPAPHSAHSSISSASTYPYYTGSYAGSVTDGSSVTDYGSQSGDDIASRTLPAPNQLINGFPPEPSSMMNQFNSKMSPSAQKKHKCKICDKRFTRPSSLQTHMYSHTGEKPFACDHDGCGRHFSVVSNLRRHKKVHKDGSRDDVSEE